MAREIVLDTETTGFDPRTGDRMIEVGCIEIDDLLPTGRTFHRLIHPERDIPAGAIAVHGITLEKLHGAPKFAEVAADLLEFIGDAPVIAHNASFDRAFLNHELGLCGQLLIEEARWIDTLQMAQMRFPGMANSLDALCRRFKISLTERSLHGALIDARLLSDVYLELKGGKARSLELVARSDGTGGMDGPRLHGARPTPLSPRLTEAELHAHAAFVAAELGDQALWLNAGA